MNADARKKAGKGADGSGGRGKKKNLSENLPEGLEGKATDLAAAELGISGRTAEKAAVVVDEIDKLRPCYAPVAMV